MKPKQRAKIIIESNGKELSVQQDELLSEEILHLFSLIVQKLLRLYKNRKPRLTKWDICNVFSDVFMEALNEYRNEKE